MLVAYCRLCRHYRNLAEEGCLLSRFHFTCCRYFLGHVACRNLPWQGLVFLTGSPSNLTRLYYDGSAAKSHSTTTQYRQLRRLTDFEGKKFFTRNYLAKDKSYTEKKNFSWLIMLKKILHNCMSAKSSITRGFRLFTVPYFSVWSSRSNASYC